MSCCPLQIWPLKTCYQDILKIVSLHDVESGSDITPYNKVDSDFVSLRNDVHYNVA